jgi:hypothetical protein
MVKGEVSVVANRNLTNGDGNPTDPDGDGHADPEGMFRRRPSTSGTL